MSGWLHTYRPVIERLGEFRDLGTGRGKAICPRCGRGSTLWVSLGDQGKLLIKCYPAESGKPACRADEVLRVMGLDLRYLFPDWEEKTAERKQSRGRSAPAKGGSDMRKNNGGADTKWTIEAVYAYYDFDSTGRPFKAFEVVKKRGSAGEKDFPTRRDNPQFDSSRPGSRENPEFIWNLDGVRRTLYRLPELRMELARHPDRWVLVVEGEKDVETALGGGLVATCNPGGVLKWTDKTTQYTEELKGRNVIVIPDEDAPNLESGLCPGIDHARQVARLLLPVARAVKIVRLPDQPIGGDLTDWWQRQTGNDEERKKKFTAICGQFQVVKSPEEIDRQLQPRKDGPQSAKNAPQNGNGTAAPVNGEPAPVGAEPIQAAAPPNGEPAAGFVELGRLLSGLNKVSPAPRSAAEAFGLAAIAFTQYQVTASKPQANAEDVSTSALLAAAHLIRAARCGS